MLTRSEYFLSFCVILEKWMKLPAADINDCVVFFSYCLKICQKDMHVTTKRDHKETNINQ